MESKQAVVTFSGFIKYSWEAGSWGYKTNNNEPTNILSHSGSPFNGVVSSLACQMPVSPKPGCLVGSSPLLILGAKAKEGAMV